ncbi:MAG TPA: hypothetical protein VHJ00_10270 [Bradyrhizobium sp.]|jgi:hypothetical protein|nr:hypothetical protein [Bradyrhizobium sp.]
MNWAWATSLDHIWRSQSFPMWVTLGAAGFFAIIVLITILRAEKSVATGALTVITLLAIGIAVAATLRGHEPAARSASSETRSSPATMVTLPALACIDDLAGDTVGQACEKVVFGSPESTAAAVNYAASMLTRLTALGDATTAQRTMSAEMQAVRRAIERDRYGLVAQVLLRRDRCTPTQCAAYRSLTDNHQIITNMDERAFDSLVARYSPSWNAPQMTAATTSPLAMMPPSLPTGKPTNAEFPSSANTPPVSIMTPEPGTGTRLPAAAAAAPTPAARPAQTAAAPPAPGAAAAKKPPAAKRAAPAAPTPISPAAQAPAASED